MVSIVDSPPWPVIKLRRNITGISAVFLPLCDDGTIDWPSFRRHLERTIQAGLIPAVNMDTGFVPFLDRPERERVLRETRDVLGSSEFVAGAFVPDRPGDSFQPGAYLQSIQRIQDLGGLPIIFQSFGLTSLDDEAILEAYQTLARDCPRFLAFELSTQFAPFGRIYSLETFRGLLSLPQCLGLKHSSLSRPAEWQRLLLRDQIRPEFKVFTGNDWAIDMVMYGSDYLLGLSTFAPDAFARRDRFWAEGDPRFFELNDLLQYLGHFAFRPPVAAYKHSAAQFLRLRGWISSDRVPDGCPVRPSSDLAILSDILDRLEHSLACNSP